MNLGVIQAARRLRRRPLTTLLALTLLTAILLLAGLAGTLFFNLQVFMAEVEREVGLVVYLAEDAPAGRLQELTQELRSLPGVQAVRPVPRSLALADLRSSLGEDAVLLDELGAEVLPDTVELIPGSAATGTGGMQALSQQIRSMPGVASVARAGQGQDSLVRLTALLSLGRAGGSSITVVMLLLVAWIMASLAGLEVMDRTREVRLLRLLGASETFIARPFLVEGFLLTMTAVLLAVTGLLGVIGALRTVLGPDAALLGLRIELPPLTTGAIFVIVALLMGVVGSYLGASRAGVR